MKLIMAIINADDCSDVMENLSANEFQVTKLSSVGGFLKVGNVTIIVGTKPENVDSVIDIIKKTCCSRKELSASPFVQAGLPTNWPVEAQVGGATIFVIDLDRYEKV